MFPLGLRLPEGDSHGDPHVAVLRRCNGRLDEAHAGEPVLDRGVDDIGVWRLARARGADVLALDRPSASVTTVVPSWSDGLAMSTVVARAASRRRTWI